MYLHQIACTYNAPDEEDDQQADGQTDKAGDLPAVVPLGVVAHAAQTQVGAEHGERGEDDEAHHVAHHVPSLRAVLGVAQELTAKNKINR